MKVGIISDTHDNIWNMDKIFAMIKNSNIETLIHCGDLCAPFIVKKLAELGMPVHFVFGNTDDRFLTTRVSANYENMNLYGDLAEFELDGKKFGVTHFPRIATALARSGDFDVVCFGHNHTKSEERIGKTLMVNPGEASGVAKDASFAIYDTKTDKVEFFEIK
ncbi:MAG: metallophosphatase family protein [Nanoarchaeota archaeon]|nr:metallophosphatase family protein [Nanoarchaeota archaeon]